MNTTLQQFHQAFQNSLTQKTYIHINTQENSHITLTIHKEQTLSLIFQVASQRICDLATNREDIQTLSTLVADGESLYQRYCNKTNTWTRWFLKKLERYSPNILKTILPKLFASGVEQAEKTTQTHYQKYRTALTNKISILRHLPSTVTPISPQAQPSNECPSTPTRGNLTLIPQTPAVLREHIPTNEELQNMSTEDLWDLEQQLLNYYLELSKQEIQNTNPERPTSKPRAAINDLKERLKKLAYEAKAVYERRLGTGQEQKTEARLKSYLSKLALETKENLTTLATTNHTQFERTFRNLYQTILQITDLPYLIPHQNHFLTTSGIDPTLFDLFKNKELFSSPTINLIGTCLEEPWKRANQHIHFTTRRIGFEMAPILVDEDTKPVRRVTQPQHFKVELKNVDSFKEALKKEGWASPLSLTIDCSEHGVNFDQFKKLVELQKDIPSISLTGITGFNFEEMGLSQEDERFFIKHLPLFSFSASPIIHFASHDKTSLSAGEFSALLKLCPTVELMQQCLLASREPEKITIPCQILAKTRLDLSGYPLSVVNHLLPQFIHLEELILDQVDFSTTDLENLYSLGLLNSLKNLTIKQGKLSTDVLFFLTKISTLAFLSLPELSQGTYSLNQLPTFTDPVAIKLFYTSQPLTRPLATMLYTGLPLHATPFQIELTHHGEPAVFGLNHFVLDPSSVIQWLQDEHFKRLQPQISIQSIVADSVNELNDFNLVAFVKKFPNVKELSFRNCPNITGKGIQQLLQTCPQIKKIDLSGSLGIKVEFLEQNFPLIQASKTVLILSDTGISADEAQVYCQTLNKQIVFEKHALKITEEDLQNQTLDNILNAHLPLHQLNRIDLKGCQSLTDADLSLLLARLNVDQQITEDGCLIDNPQRLNITILDLEGCSQVTATAFEAGVAAQGGVDLKILNSLNQIVIGNTQIDQTLIQSLYPQLTFQTTFNPITLSLEISTTPIESDFTLLFQTHEQTEGVSLETHKNLLTSQSGYFRETLRGNLQDTTLIHQCATPEAVAILSELLKGRSFPPTLDWKVAGNVAELVRPECLDLPSIHYHKLIRHIRSQFTLENASEMFFLAKQLNDEKGKKEFEKKLIQIAQEREETKQTILSQLASTYHLADLEQTLNDLAAEDINRVNALTMEELEMQSLALAVELEIRGNENA